MADPDASPISRASDDILEYVFEAAIQDYSGRCDFNTTLRLSHVCSRFREIILARSSFWNSICVTAKRSAEAVSAILQRSRGVPVHLAIANLMGVDNPECDPSVIQSMERLHTAVALLLYHLPGGPMAELLRNAVSATRPSNLRMLEISYAPSNALHLLGGHKLAVLSLQNIGCESFFGLETVFSLAINLEVLRLICVDFDESQNSTETLAHRDNDADGQQLQVIDIDFLSDQDVERVLDILEAYYPGAVKSASMVEIRSRSCEQAVEVLDIPSIPTLEHVVCASGLEYWLHYPTNMSRIRPLGIFAVAELEQQYGGMHMQTRGFDAGLGSLKISRPRRDAVGSALAKTRSIELRHMSTTATMELVAACAATSWPNLEEYTQILDVSSEIRIELEPPRGEPLRLPRLVKMNISLNPHSPTDDVPAELKLHESWANACAVVINQFTLPQEAIVAIAVRDSARNHLAEAVADQLRLLLKGSDFQRHTFSILSMV